jgi:hypothetical protein
MLSSVGSTPTWGTVRAVMKLVDVSELRSEFCGFDSHQLDKGSVGKLAKRSDCKSDASALEVRVLSLPQ